MTELTGAAMAPVSSLPVRVKRFDRESMDSFIRRLAAANGADVRVIRTWLIEQDAMLPLFDRDDWFEVWGRLAGSSDGRPSREASASATPRTAPRIDRPLCRRCSRGQDASGDLTLIGLVCLRHEVWIDPHDGMKADHDAIRAERRFRHRLVRRGISLFSVEMRFARRLVLLAITPGWIDAHQRTYGSRSAYAAAYAAQVTIAIDLFERDELSALNAAPDSHALDRCTDWVSERIDRLSLADEPWRAGALLSNLIRILNPGHTHSHIGDPPIADILERLAR